jgi:hypothetical protein
VWLGEFVLRGSGMSTLGLIEYQDASAEVRAVYDDILAVRKTDWIKIFGTLPVELVLLACVVFYRRNLCF